MSDSDIVNPGLVNVADQSDGPLSVDQNVTVTRPCTNAGPLVQAADLAAGKGTSSPSPSNVTPAMTAQRSVDAGTASPTSPDTVNTTDNTVVGQPESIEQFYRTINVYP